MCFSFLIFFQSQGSFADVYSYSPIFFADFGRINKNRLENLDSDALGQIAF